jgi:hypothetical protein
MLKSVIILILTITLTFPLFSQNTDKINLPVDYEEKSIKKAVLLSAVLPGAGQFYVNPRGITTYLFPLIEISFLAGYFYYHNKGEDLEKNYEKYATQEIIGYEDGDVINGSPIYRYSRDKFHQVANDLIAASGNSFYNNHFNLDDSNTQHFYEDIGKYPKYIFGWTDWYDIYAADENGDWAVNLNWIWFEEELGNKWAGNDPTNPNSAYYLGNEELYDLNRGKYSQMRAVYIKQRKEAEENYDISNLCSFGLAFNHIFSAIDAVRVTKKYNADLLTQYKIKVKFGPMFTENHIYPAVYLFGKF